MNGKGSLSEFDDHAKKSADPHPKDGTRATDGNGSGNAGEIAGTHRSRQGGTESAEGRNIALVILLGKLAEKPDKRLGKPPDLNKSRLNAEPKADAQDQDQSRNAPYNAIDYFKYLHPNSSHRIAPITSSCKKNFTKIEQILFIFSLQPHL
jgi:hypothetical protein